MKFFETHAHYNDEVYDVDREEVLDKIRKNNVKYVVNVGYDIKSSIDSIKLANTYNYIYAAIGIHPHDVNTANATDIYDIYNNSKSKKIVAIGEIGLDFAYVKDNKKEQIKLFESQIELANALKLPIVIHSRDASLDTYNVIKNKRAQYGTLFHCFQPSDDLVRLVLENGYMVAFGGNITFKRNESFKRYIEKIPLEQIVIETDSPYLSPEPFRGKRNDSSNLEIVCNKLAMYKNVDSQELSNIVFDNAKKYFNI